MIHKEIYRTTQTIESYLLSIVNPEWAVAIAISLAQDIPEGARLPSTAPPGWLGCFSELGAYTFVALRRSSVMVQKGVCLLSSLA